ncbi:MAG: hypothetical protein AAF514_05095 [Verrucomicrobiota bacterium]
MKLFLSIALAAAACLFLAGLRASTSEALVPEDGKVAEPVLPFDREISKVKYETATFGLG